MLSSPWPAGSATTITATQLQNNWRRGCGWGWGLRWGRGGGWGWGYNKAWMPQAKLIEEHKPQVAATAAGVPTSSRPGWNATRRLTTSLPFWPWAACHCNWCCIRTSFTQLPQFLVVATSSWCCCLLLQQSYCSRCCCGPGCWFYLQLVVRKGLKFPSGP